MIAHDDAARDTANARADALLAMHARLEAVTVERDELAAKLVAIETLTDSIAVAAQNYDTGNVGYRHACDTIASDLRQILRGNP